jgi:hypothetical protein
MTKVTKTGGRKQNMGELILGCGETENRVKINKEAIFPKD